MLLFFADKHDPHASVLGARGIGEVGVAAAIANAIFHATGKRIRWLSVHIESLLG